MRDEGTRLGNFGALALLLAMLAFLGSASHEYFGPIESAPREDDPSFSEKAKKLRDKVVSAWKGEKEADARESAAGAGAPWGPDRYARLAIFVTSILSVLLAVLAFVKKDPIRVVAGAIFLAAVAMALQYLLVSLILVVAVVIVFFVLNGLALTA